MVICLDICFNYRYFNYYFIVFVVYIYNLYESCLVPIDKLVLQVGLFECKFGWSGAVGIRYSM